MKKNRIHLVYAEGLNHAQLEDLRVQAVRGLEIPEYLIITNYEVKWTVVDFDLGEGHVITGRTLSECISNLKRLVEEENIE